MSLKGSLQTVALPEVLGFLSSTTKTGELRVEGARGEGRLWFRDGSISAVQVERGPNPVEAVFQLLRVDQGDFSFSGEEVVPDGVRMVEPGAGRVDLVLEEAQQRLAEWTDIVAVVPSLEHRVTLAADAPGETVQLLRSQWALVVAIGEGRSVGQVIADQDLGEFDGCRAIKTLVEESLVRVEEPARDAEVAPAEPGTQPAGLPLPALDVLGFNSCAPAAEDSEPVSIDDHVSTDADTAGSADEVPAHDPTGAALDFGAAGWPAGDGQEHWVEPECEEPMPAFGAGYAETPYEDHPLEEAAEADSDPEGVGTDHRAALQALLAEVTTSEAGEQVDGLADRGPWTHSELASFDDWKAEEAGAAAAPVNAYAGSTDMLAHPQPPIDYAPATEPEIEEAPAPVEEPINRGLLLKFLSSVRN